MENKVEAKNIDTGSLLWEVFKKAWGGGTTASGLIALSFPEIAEKVKGMEGVDATNFHWLAGGLITVGLIKKGMRWFKTVMEKRVDRDNSEVKRLWIVVHSQDNRIKELENLLTNKKIIDKVDS